MTQDERLLKRLDKLNRKINVMFAFLAGTTAASLLFIFGNFANIADAQTDTLNQLNYIRQEIEAEEPKLESRSETVDPAAYILKTEERDLVCRVVAAEARGEDLQGMMAVAQTILDRSELWNMTPSEVVQAPGQYAAPYTGKISDEIKLAVANVFDGGIRVFAEPITHFAEGEPYWAEGKTSRGSVGRHQFWY